LMKTLVHRFINSHRVSVLRNLERIYDFVY